MSHTRSLDLDSFVDYVRRRPSRLGCWRDSTAGRYPTLAWLNVLPVEELRHLSTQMGGEAALALYTPVHHNQVGLASGWVTKYMSGKEGGQSATDADRRALWRVSRDYWILENAIADIRVGHRSFSSERRKIRLAYAGDLNLDALGRLLNRADRLEPRRNRASGPDPKLRSWLVSEGTATSWTRAPNWVRTAFRKRALDALRQYRRSLPDSVDVGGFTIEDFGAYWRELLAWAMHMQGALTVGSTEPLTVSPLTRRKDFIGQVAAAAGIAEDACERMTNLLELDLDRCPDGALTPLIPLDDWLLPMSSLILPSAPQRNLLAILQSDPARVGEAGRLLGAAGEKEVLSLVKRLGGSIRSATRVKVRRQNGDSAGDLDVVLCDERTSTLVIFEIKWHLPADGNREVNRVEQDAIEKRKRLVRLRDEMARGNAIPIWPAGWPDTRGYRERWFVLTHDVLPMRSVIEDDVTIRSFQLLERTVRPGASLADLISALDHPPEPPEAARETQWESLRFGDLQIEIELITT